MTSIEVGLLISSLIANLPSLFGSTGGSGKSGVSEISPDIIKHILGIL